MSPWKQMMTSKEGDQELVIKIPNPVEPEYPFKIRVSVYGPLKEHAKPTENEPRWWGRADFASRELFRVYGDTREVVQEKLVDGMRQLFGSLVEAVKP